MHARAVFTALPADRRLASLLATTCWGVSASALRCKQHSCTPPLFISLMLAHASLHARVSCAPEALARLRRLPAIWWWCEYVHAACTKLFAYRLHDSSNNGLYIYVYISSGLNACMSFMHTMAAHACVLYLPILFAAISLQMNSFCLKRVKLCGAIAYAMLPNCRHVARVTRRSVR